MGSCFFAIFAVLSIPQHLDRYTPLLPNIYVYTGKYTHHCCYSAKSALVGVSLLLTHAKGGIVIIIKWLKRQHN